MFKRASAINVNLDVVTLEVVLDLKRLYKMSEYNVKLNVIILLLTVSIIIHIGVVIYKLLLLPTFKLRVIRHGNHY